GTLAGTDRVLFSTWLAIIAAAAIALLVGRIARRIGGELDAALAERRRAEERYRRLFEHDLAGVGSVSLDGRFLACNPAFARILGYDSPEDLLAHDAGAIYLHAEDRPAANPHRKDVAEISRPAQPAGDLTRQLLTFSRRQPIEPRVLRLNDVVADTDKMLRRLIGQEVQLVTVLAPTLGTIRADSSQVHQVLLNLAVNARDAMPDGGTLTIETHEVDIDGAYAQEHVAAQPGAYALLAVSDT